MTKKILGCFLFFCIASCSPASGIATVPLSITPPPLQTVTPTAKDAVATSSQTDIPKSPDPNNSVTPTIPKPVSEEKNCPVLLSESLPFKIEGNLLFSYSGGNSPTGVWSISKGNLVPDLVFDPPSEFAPAFYTKLSPDGSKLAWALYQNQNTTPDLVIYDIERQEYTKYRPKVSWAFISDWNEDGRLILLGDTEDANGEARTEFFYFDPSTELSELITNIPPIPSDHFFDEMRPWTSFVSSDPKGELLLYTKLEEDGITIMLINQQDENIIWEHSLTYIIALPKPDWTADGQFAALSFWTTEDGGQYKLFKLARDGQLQELMAEPVDRINYFDVRYLSWSLDQRFLHYAVGHTPLRDGPGYVFDLNEHILREICDPEINEFLDGSWLPSNQLIYSVVTNSGNAELRLLDLTTWQTQILAVIENNQSGEPFRLHGWVP